MLVIFSFNKWKACSVDWLARCRISHFTALNNLSVCTLLQTLYIYIHADASMVDTDNDTPISLSVFLSSLDVVKLFVLTMEIILSSHTLVIFCGLAGLLVLLRWPVHSLFFKNVPGCWFARSWNFCNSPIELFCFSVKWLNPSLLLTFIWA